MNEKPNYIKWIRDKAGQDLIFLNFAGGLVCNERNEILLQRRGYSSSWGLPGGAVELGESATSSREASFRRQRNVGITILSKRQASPSILQAAPRCC
ncbi:NUDIX domain-containing protein [Paenibacillus glycanilyticus]|uniref:NUDIX domain-containing protein n=1 Tax=Paenibacillus glycanilyticus TaxID=126569 RepID=UPI0037CBAFB3